MAANPAAYVTLLAAAIPVARRLEALDTDRTVGQGYHIEQLVDECRRLAAVVNSQIASVPPVGCGPA